MGHPALPPQKGLFELQVRSGSADWQTVEGFDGYRCGGMAFHGMLDNAARKAQIANKASGNTMISLAPGQEAVVYLSGKEDPILAKAAGIRIVLRQNAATAPKGGWLGTVATPPVAARRDENMPNKLTDNLPFPAFYPDLDPKGFTGGNMSGNEPAVRQLWIPNQPLLAALNRFDADGVRQEFERRMVTENDEPMKILLASVAAGNGSQAAALYLLELMQGTDYNTAQNVFAILARLVYHFDERQPEWLLAMVEAALSDGRYATGRRNWAGSPVTLSYMADEDARLALALGQVKCRQAVPFLMEMVRRTKSRMPIMALGDMGDPRSIPTLLDIVKTTGKTAKDDASGNGLSPENFARAVAALADLKAADAVPELLDYAGFPDVIKALEKIGDRRAVPVLRALVENEGRIIRDGKSIYPKVAAERLVHAKIALASLDDGDAVPRLAALLGDKSFGEFDRREVVWRLGERADPRAIPLLIKAIHTDPSGAVVNQAITVLAFFKYKVAVAGLIECFDADFKGKNDWKRAYEPGMFQDNIAESLRAITGRSTGTDKKQWLEWWQNDGQADDHLK